MIVFLKAFEALTPDNETLTPLRFESKVIDEVRRMPIDSTTMGMEELMQLHASLTFHHFQFESDIETMLTLLPYSSGKLEEYLKVGDEGEK